jgi:tetratricopeptide (TPR) repeat protein
LSQFTLARALAEGGHKDEALFFADKAATLDLANAQYAYYAGWLYYEFRLFEFALPLLQRSVAIEPRAAVSQLTLAQCYDIILQPGKASEHFAAAYALETSRPRREFIQMLHAQNLAHANQRELAKEKFEQILLGKGPLALRAAVELAWLSGEGPQSRIGKLLSRRISEKDISPDPKSLALQALGRLYNNDEQYDRAFECWRASREIVKSQKHYIRDRQLIYERSTSVFTRQLFDAIAPFTCQTEAVVVVCGMPRSGTTLTEQIIASHSQAAGAGEIARWFQLEHEFLERHKGKRPAQYFAEPEHQGELLARGEEILHILRVVSGSFAPRIVEKTPHSFANLGYIKLCCPRSKFIHIKRHPLDAFISTYQNPFNQHHGYAYDQIEYAKEYLWHIQMMNHWMTACPENILSVKYEDLAKEPESNARRIIEFIGLPWEDQCLEFYRGNRAVKTFSNTQVRSPVYDSSIGRWKLYEKHLGPIKEYLENAGFRYE